MLIERVLKILHAEIGLHLELRDGLVKAAQSLAPVAAALPEVPAQQTAARAGERLINALRVPGGETVGAAGVKIIAVTPSICKIGEPVEAHKAAFSAEKLAISAAPGAQHGAFPLPGPVRVRRKPELPRRHLLHGKPRHQTPEQRQKAKLRHPFGQRFGGCDRRHFRSTLLFSEVIGAAHYTPRPATLQPRGAKLFSFFQNHAKIRETLKNPED